MCVGNCGMIILEWIIFSFFNDSVWIIAVKVTV